jgi:hypothetical protein
MYIAWVQQLLTPPPAGKDISPLRGRGEQQLYPGYAIYSFIFIVRAIYGFFINS